MSGFLLDTNVISELIRPAPGPRVVRWVDETEESLLYLSVLTLGEIRKGIMGLGRKAHRGRLESLAGIRTAFALSRPHPDD